MFTEESLNETPINSHLTRHGDSYQGFTYQGLTYNGKEYSLFIYMVNFI